MYTKSNKVVYDIALEEKEILRKCLKISSIIASEGRISFIWAHRTRIGLNSDLTKYREATEQRHGNNFEEERFYKTVLENIWVHLAVIKPYKKTDSVMVPHVLLSSIIFDCM